MANVVDSYCTLLMHNDDITSVKTSDIRTKLESANVEDKKAALKQVILLALNGESQRNMLMPVIKSCLQCDDDNLKKILLIFWESCDMTDISGKLLPEMILVCNYIRNDLESPNEYIRGSTLRLLCKIKHPEILESLIPVVIANLSHRHSYVRKNAILAVFEIYQALPDLIPDAPEKIADLLTTETNIQTKRNAFLMLFHCDISRAVAYLDQVITQIPTFGESFQMVVLELIRKVCRMDPTSKGKYIRCVYALLNSESNTVAFEGACTLLTLSTSPTAVRACVSTLSQLLTAEADHNVKLIILDRLGSLRTRHEKIVQESIMDILRTLTTPNIDIRKKTLGITRSLISNRNVHDVVNFLKKEIMSTETSIDSLAAPYRTLLVESAYECAMRFPDVASSVVLLLLNFISDDSGNGPLEVMYYVRGIIQEYEHLRSNILEKLLNSFCDIKQAVVYRVALWVIGEYAYEARAIEHAKSVIFSSLAPIPFESTSEMNISSPKNEEPSSQVISSRPVILSDGTYAQQSTVSASSPVDISASDGKITLHSLIKDGQYFLATVACSAITKLTLKESELFGFGSPASNVAISNALIVMATILRFGTVSSTNLIDQDSSDRIRTCIRALTEPGQNSDIFLKQCREVFIDVLKERKMTSEICKRNEMPKAQVDDCLSIRHLKPRATLGEFGLEDDEDVGKAVGNDVLGNDAFSTKLNRVFQLTGFSDPVYGEAYVTVHQYDIVLDILIVNQTNKTLQNLSVELTTSGDLKLVERPQGHTIIPYGSINIQAIIKVSSTESGMIFGNIVYDMSGSTERQLVVMNTVLLDIMDYIVPATCSETDFRTMWVEFEWENKVPVNTDIQDLEEYVEHIINLANMKCISERGEGYSDCNFLAVNLYARSIFGEDALVNVSVEKLDSGNISGYIRIRAKTQGIALSLGDRIIANQRQPRKVNL